VLDEITLRRLYLEEQRSIRDIARLANVPTRAVYDALIRYRIPRRPAGFHQKSPQPAQASLDEATLRGLYQHEQRSIREIAALQQVSTRVVYDALSRYRIPRRPAGQPRPAPDTITFGDQVLDKPGLQRLYQEDGLSIAELAVSLACPPSRIRSALVRWGIARRRRGRQEGSNSR
jgi:predicted DNA-binding protein YlxM (UPF0122 family)